MITWRTGAWRNSLTGFCDTCNHRITAHGDRAIGGVCAAGNWPISACWCPNYVCKADAA